MKKILSLVLFAMVLMFSNVFALQGDEDLLAYWTFDNLSDSTGNGYDLTNSGANFTTVGCHMGNCYEFDGLTDYMETNGFRMEQQGAGNAYSMVAWFRTTSTDGGFVMGQVDNSDTVPALYTVPGSEVRGYMKGGPGSNPQATAIYGDDAWHMISITSTSGGGHRLYFDGVEVDFVSLFSWGYNPVDLIFGGQKTNQVSQRMFAGFIDEASVWNRTLNASDMLDLYNNGIELGAGPTPNINVMVNTPVDGFNYTFDVTSLNFDVDTSGDATCEYEYLGSNTSMTTTDNLSHNANFSLGASQNSSSMYEVSFHCFDLMNNITVTEDVTFYRQGEPLILDIIVPIQNQIFVATTEQIMFYLETNYVATCSYQANSDPTVEFDNTDSSIHTTLFQVNSSVLVYATNFSCVGTLVPFNTSGVITFFVDELMQNSQAVIDLTPITSQLPGVGGDVGGFFDGINPGAVAIIAGLAIITVIAGLIGLVTLIRFGGMR